jgi:hypothetical protein
MAGSQYSLNLQADLIGFMYVPEHYTREHLAHTLINILDWIGIADKVGDI